MWKPLPGDTEQCVVCEVALAMSKEDTKELRLQAENEKVFYRLIIYHD